jgi:hypothetical protein
MIASQEQSADGNRNLRYGCLVNQSASLLVALLPYAPSFPIAIGAILRPNSSSFEEGNWSDSDICICVQHPMGQMPASMDH